MSTTDAKVAELTSRISHAKPSSSNSKRTDDGDHSDLDDEELFAQLEEEIENGANPELREQGIQRLKAEMDRLQQMKSSGHGRYDELTDEKAVIRTSANEPRCVVHFYHTDFKRCQIMDRHLAALALKYFNTRFIRVFVENVPWLVEKLGVKILPCVVCFIDGVTKDRLVGFEELGNNDKFETATLEWRLLNTGVIQKDQKNASEVVYGAKSVVRQHIRGQRDDDSDFDLDD
ncbi:thioredoxin-like protein [Laetiporus sulphureus 93-53]|uniref:Thioredoxin-like protein n=1 Tax=Laetiporus sulphureus 93-53 TaxID=1314785 RepID=A0A165I2Z2_9APHY|nr:thioredoxin-like protein [Laetiporus sulphureus 93-53]KZT12523.1 thioredoxin-like protein [Laetiporus sulphureus 93-53]